MTKRRFTNVACHEAAHAVAFLSNGVEVTSVTLRPGRCWQIQGDVSGFEYAVGCLAGAAAERHAGLPAGPSKLDTATAKTALKAAMGDYAAEGWDWATDAAEALVADEWDGIAAVAEALQERGELTGEEAKEIWIGERARAARRGWAESRRRGPAPAVLDRR